MPSTTSASVPAPRARARRRWSTTRPRPRDPATRGRPRRSGPHPGWCPRPADAPFGEQAANASAAPTGSRARPSTTGARSRSTPSSTVGEVRAAMPVAADLQPERRGAVLEVGDRRLRGGSRVGVGERRTDVPAVLRAGQRASAGVRGGAGHTRVRQSCDQGRGAERRHPDAVERGPGQRVPDRRVRVVGTEPAGLAEHGRGGLLPVADLVLPAVREGQMSLCGGLLVHGAHPRDARQQEPAGVNNPTPRKTSHGCGGFPGRTPRQV